MTRVHNEAAVHPPRRTPVRGVLVTGVDAPVGEWLTRSLLADPNIGHIIAVAPRAERIALPQSSRLTFLPVELNKERHVHDLLFGPARELGVEVVIHAATAGDATHDSRSAHALNVDATRSLLTLCERHPTIRRFVLRSFAEVYQIEADLPVIIAEDHPLNLHAGAPQFVRDRVEADLHACVRMGLSSLQIQVLRTAEVLAPGSGSQLFDYLASPVCFRPFGYDPMLNLLSLSDVTSALYASVWATEQGVFNIPGFDTLPLSLTIRKWGRASVAIPNSLMSPLYRWRSRLRGTEFRYGMNRRRFHYSGVLDGRRAREVLGFVPEHGLDWPAG